MENKLTFKYMKKVFILALPVMLHQLILAFANLVDNIMIGSNGKHAINAVGVSNQIFFVILLLGFGISNGAGVYIAQQFGSKKFKQMHHTFIIGIISAILLGIISAIFVTVFKEVIFSRFTTVAIQQELGFEYLQIAVFAYPLVLISTMIGGAYRSCSNTVTPMIAGVIAICVNTFLNFLLINGNFGAPALGVQGAAIATVAARCIELAVLLIIMKYKHMPFIPKFKDFFNVPFTLVKKVYKTSIPLSTNEFLWGLGYTTIMSFYGIRSADDYTIIQIASTTAGLLFTVMSGFSTAVAILVGQDLGKGAIENAKIHAKLLAKLSVIVAIVITFIAFMLSFIIPEFYNIDSEMKAASANVLRIVGLYFPVYNLTTTYFFILRSGGDAKGVLMIDALFMWLVAVPYAYAAIMYVPLSIPIVYIIVQSSDLIKLVISYLRYKQNKWVKTLI